MGRACATDAAARLGVWLDWLWVTRAEEATARFSALAEMRDVGAGEARGRRFSVFISVCLTSKMSETDAWRRACDSTICDKHPASLHRIVRLRFHFLISDSAFFA